MQNARWATKKIWVYVELFDGAMVVDIINTLQSECFVAYTILKYQCVAAGYAHFSLLLLSEFYFIFVFSSPRAKDPINEKI